LLRTSVWVFTKSSKAEKTFFQKQSSGSKSRKSSINSSTWRFRFDFRFCLKRKDHSPCLANHNCLSLHAL
jgi:hypothetical protein